jgi:predicted Fe-S protein YdhL (DUF1289 family)
MIEKQIKKYNLIDPKQYADEVDYWKGISSEEKLDILQELREQYILLYNKQEIYNESRKGLRRFYKVTKLSRS